MARIIKFVSGIAAKCTQCRGEWHSLRQPSVRPYHTHRGYNLSLRLFLWIFPWECAPLPRRIFFSPLLYHGLNGLKDGTDY
jgi:hypothetical protein